MVFTCSSCLGSWFLCLIQLGLTTQQLFPVNFTGVIR
jgi:hypothetical protein